MSRGREWRWLQAGLILADVVALAAAFTAAYLLRFVADLWPEVPGDWSGTDGPLYPSATIALLALYVALFAIVGLYSRENVVEGPHEYALVLHACTYGLVGASLIAFFIVRDPWISRSWLLMSWLLAIGFVGLTRFAIRRVVYRLRRRDRFVTRVVIVGANEQGKAIARQLTPATASGVEVVGFVDDYLPPGTPVMAGIRVLGEPMQLNDLARKLDVDEVIAVPPAMSWEALHYLVHEAQAKDAPYVVRLSAGLYDVLGTGVRVSRRGYIPLLTIDKTRVIGMDAYLKRALDWGLAGLALVLLAPLALLAALALWIVTRRAPLDYQERIGRLGVPYHQWRFAHGPLFEPGRRGPAVRVLRRLLVAGGFEKYPALINVLRREMSLVGPRPIDPADLPLYGAATANILALRPGLTGPWWVGGDRKIPHEQRVQLDLVYHRNYTIWLDLQVLFQTVRMLLVRSVSPQEPRLGESSVQTDPNLTRARVTP